MQKTTKKKIPAVVCALLALAGILAYLLILIMAMRGEMPGIPATVLIIVVYGVPVIAVLIGVLLALRHRLKEIDGGEEEDAKQY